MNALLKIQTALKVPKNQYNSFGKYSFRNAEDIQEALKPLLLKEDATLTLSDNVVEIGGRIFLKATATLSYPLDGKQVIETCSGFALHAMEQKGMADAQITGSASSYARKYALGGMFLIDDAKDDDSSNTHDKAPKKESKPAEPMKPVTVAKAWLNPNTPEWKDAVEKLQKGLSIEDIEKFFLLSKVNKTKLAAEAKPQTI